MKFQILKKICLLSILTLLASIPALASEGTITPQQKSFNLKVQNNLISLQAEEASFKEILGELERKTGIKVKIFDRVEDKKITLNIKSLPFDEIHFIFQKMGLDNFAVVYDERLDSKIVFILPRGENINKFIKNKKVLYAFQTSVNNGSIASAVNSPEVTKLDPPRTSPDPWDLRKFFQMDDPLEAAKALREHAKSYNLSLDDRQSIKIPIKKDKGKTPRELVRLFNGTEISPPSGIENSLLEKANNLIASSKGSEKIIAILHTQNDMSIGEILSLLDANIKVYDSAGSSAFIVRLPASSIPLLQSQSYVKWVGEYKADYKKDRLFSKVSG
jgi:hypothetical protein